MAPWECSVVQEGHEQHDEGCAKHVDWAIKTGFKHFNWYYPKGTTATVADMQCALFLKEKYGATEADGKGDGHGCSKPPCSGVSYSMKNGGHESVKHCLKPETETRSGGVMPGPRVPTITEAPTEAPAKVADGPSIEWWGWLLIVAAILAVAALAAYALGLLGSKKPTKKRTIVAKNKVAEEAPEPEPVTTTVAAVPTYEAAPPVYTYAAPVPTQTIVAPPVYAVPTAVSSIAAPVTTIRAAPVTTISAAPVTMVAAPLTTISASSRQCVCGNIFMDDSNFCRKCGRHRQ